MEFFSQNTKIVFSPIERERSLSIDANFVIFSLGRVNMLYCLVISTGTVFIS